MSGTKKIFTCLNLFPSPLMFADKNIELRRNENCFITPPNETEGEKKKEQNRKKV